MHTPEDVFGYPGVMAERMRGVDWAATPLGPVHAWPASLVTAVRILLHCRLPMYIAWGGAHTQLFNDAYLPILGAKHAGALGASAQDTWHEIWPVIHPMWQQVWAGESVGFDDFKLTIDRFGYSEDCYFNFSYSAVPDDSGRPGGILVTFAETTAKVLLQQRQDFLLALAARLRDLPQPGAIVATVSEMLGRHLGVARVGYGEIDALDANVFVERDWSAPGMTSLAGEQRPLDSFGPDIIAVLRRGEALRLDDIGADPRSAPFAQGYASIGTRALLVVPIIKSGRLRAILYLHEAAPRRWRDEDVELAREVADHSWQTLERARAELALRESEDHFRHTVALNPDVQWTADRRGAIDRIAPRWRDWTGADHAHWLAAVHPDERADVEQAWTAAVASGTPFDATMRVRLRDGSHEWMHVRALPRRDAAGAVVRWYGTTQNVQAFRLAVEQAQRRELDFRTLAEAMPNQAWLADDQGQVYWFNRRVYEYAGVEENQLGAGGWMGIVHPDDLAGTLDNWAASLRDATPYENEFRLRHGASGEYRWFIARALPAPDPGTGKLRWIGTNTDVHAQKAAAASLARMNRSLEAEVDRRTADRDRMWRLTTDIMLVARFDSTVVAVNPAWTDMLGWAEEELIGMAFLDLVHPEDVPATMAEAGKLSRGLKTLHFENRYRHRDGSYRWLAWTAVPDADYIHAVARDVTREKQQKEALEQTELALRQAQKLESIGKLTGGVAHDFNNILQIVGGSLQLLRAQVGEAGRRRLETALRAVERGAKLSAQLLAFARRQPLQPAVVHPGRVLRDMEDLVRRALGEQIDVEIVCAAACWSAMLDQNQLENVLLNLAINSRDAMPHGGRLTIEAGNAALDGRHAEHADPNQEVQPGDYVMFAMTDTGCGMTPEVLEQACEPFFTTKPAGQGTGLGLSMAYGFVKQSGGHFAIYSEPGHGTTVRMYFPRSHAAVDLVPNLLDQPLVGGDETILVVEDDPDVQATVVAMLSELGYRVLKADHAQAALPILGSGAHVDLLFTDVVMPGPLRSPELARQARLMHPHIEVLFTSGYAENAIVHGGRVDPGVELLSKPYTREQLARKLRHVFNNGAQKRAALPAAAPASAPAAPRRILVVEDVPESRQLLCDMLTLLGHVAHGAGSGEAALDAFSRGSYDAVITDYGLPGISGVELATRLKRRHADLQVVFLTGYGSLFDEAPGFAYTLLPKPCDIHRLAELFAS